MGLPQDPRRAGQARHRRVGHRDPDPTSSPRPRPCSARVGAELEPVPSSPSSGDPRLRLLHGGDRTAADAVRAVFHRAWDPSRPHRGRHGEPKLGMGHPAGPEPRHEPRRRATVPLARPRSRRQVHEILRRGVSRGGTPSPSHSDQGSQGQRVRRALGAHGKARVPRLDARPWSKAPRTRAQRIRRPLQPGASSPRAGPRYAGVKARPGSWNGGEGGATGPARRAHLRVLPRRGMSEPRFVHPSSLSGFPYN
jgi:hypothetical protein